MAETNRLLTANEICERALEKIGAYGLMDTGADPDMLERAAKWLDLLVKHLSGTRRGLWLTEDNLTIPLTAEKLEYDLRDDLGADYPENGIQFPHHARLRNSDTGQTYDIEIVRRLTFDDIDVPVASGSPDCVYFDRRRNPKMKVWPQPGTDDFEIILTFTSYMPDLRPKGNNFPDLQTEVVLRESWNLGVVLLLSYQIGSGPVKKLSDGEVRQMYDDAEAKLLELDKYENFEHADEFKRVAFRRF